MSLKRKWQIVVVGGGPAGLLAAIGAARTLQTNVRQQPPEEGTGRILIVDAAKRPGDKIYATGNGRCNLTNLRQDKDCYYTDSGVDPYVFLPDAPDQWLIHFFEEIGIPLHARNGYVYPQTDQAGDIVAALLRQLRIYGVEVCSGWRVTQIKAVPGKVDTFARTRTDPDKEESFTQTRTAPGKVDTFARTRMDPDKRGIFPCSSGEHTTFQLYCQKESSDTKKDTITLTAAAVILCTGGMVNQAYGCRGDGYAFCKQWNHTIVAASPALCALVCDTPGQSRLDGVRVEGGLTLLADGKPQRTEKGSLQLTAYGISGIPAFGVSHLAARCLAKGEQVSASLDFFSEMEKDAWHALIQKRLSQIRPEDTLLEAGQGLAHEKILRYLLEKHGLVPEQKIRKLLPAPGQSRTSPAALMQPLWEELRHLTFPVHGVRGYSQAQVTAGGVRLGEVNPRTMASRRQKGLYLAGELLDVDGICGGYNLTFAMETGYKAGVHAAQNIT